jgi:hypothetical protein
VISAISPIRAYQWHHHYFNNSERQTMYNILTTLLATALIIFGSQSLDGGLLFKLALIVGGIYLGHVMTDALNKSDGV